MRDYDYREAEWHPDDDSDDWDVDEWWIRDTEDAQPATSR